MNSDEVTDKSKYFLVILYHEVMKGYIIPHHLYIGSHLAYFFLNCVQWLTLKLGHISILGQVMQNRKCVSHINYLDI